MLDIKQRVRDNEALAERAINLTHKAEIIKADISNFIHHMDEDAVAKSFHLPSCSAHSIPYEILGPMFRDLKLANLDNIFTSMMDVRDLIGLANKLNGVAVDRIEQGIEADTESSPEILQMSRDFLKAGRAEQEKWEEQKRHMDRIIPMAESAMLNSQLPKPSGVTADVKIFCDAKSPLISDDMDSGTHEFLQTETYYRLSGAYNRWAECQMNNIDTGYGFVYLLDTNNNEWRQTLLMNAIHVADANMETVCERLKTSGCLLASIASLEQVRHTGPGAAPALN